MPLFVLAHFSHHVVGALLAPLLPFIRDEFSPRLTTSQLGLLGFAYNIPYGVGQLPGGWLADRLGPRRLILIGISGVAAAGLLVGVSPSYVVMAVFLVFLGLAGGGYHPAATPLVSASVDEANRGRSLGLHQVGGTASFFLTPLIAVGIASALGWRGAFVSISIPTLLFGIALYAILGRRQRAGAATGGSAGMASVATSRARLTTLVVLGVAIQVAIFSTIWFVPTFAVDVFGASKELGGGLLAAAHFAGLLGGPLGGHLSDRVGKVPVLLTVGLIAGPAIYLLSLVSLDWSLWAVLLLMGSCQYVAMPVIEAYVITHAPQRSRSTWLGVYYFASRGGPGVIALVLGNLIARYGYDTSFTIVAATMAVIGVVSLAVLRSGRG